MIITAITAHPRKPGRFSLMVDGRELAVLSIEAIERLRLASGGVVDERLSTEIDREAATLATYDRALNLLALRARSTTELRRALVKKGELPADADAAIARLVAAGFLDDASYARQFTRSKGVGGGLSKRRLQQELRRRGVERDVAEVAIDEVFVDEEVDEAVEIERVARKKLRTLTRVDLATRRRRLYAFLARRGYGSGAISRAMHLVSDDVPPDA
jgi:regulatory protein